MKYPFVKFDDATYGETGVIVEEIGVSANPAEKFHTS
jgi:hypothetical protein